ncbi:NACHT, LRR and PYD domains-containing protein 12-like [Sardina pilchardus]|uniref:NACHT, LRR and PYD domains-containing protein 12-like n=1 Tax=Sardina pilchardus TaxID=27697 RepID=UPI002E150122
MESTSSCEPPQSDPKPQPHRPASPVPSCVSLKSDRSMDDRPVFSSGPPQSDSKPQPHRPASPVPSCVSLKSDRSMDDRPVFSSGPPASDSKPQPHRPASPVPSCVSLKSDRSMDDRPMFSSGPPESDSNVLRNVLTQDQSRCGITQAKPKLQDNHVLNRVLMNHKASMKRRFESICEGIITRTEKQRAPSIRSETQTLLNKIYTELYITEGESEGVNNEHEIWQVESASRPQSTEDTSINCNDIFKPLPGQERHIRTVMTKGIAGIGKTVSVQKFILDWAEERANQDVDFMFVLPFRELNLVRDDQYSLHRLLLDFHPELRELQDGEYKDCHIVFIFDGLDESRLPLNFQENHELSDVTQTSSVDVLMTSLIQGTLLPSALIWITSRPAATSQIPSQCISQVTEVRGFNDPQKEEYFRKRISDQNQANRIILHIKASRSLHIMCHMPVFCWISATVLQQILEQDDGKEAPKTLTEMFIHFLLIQTTRKNQKYQGESETDRQKLLESHQGAILKLAELALKHLENGKLMFYEEDLRECGIDVSEASVYSGMCTEIFREECVFHHKKVYCFVHLSIQEFLAALHVFVSYLEKDKLALGAFLGKRSHRYDLCSLQLFDLLKVAVKKALDSNTGHLDLFLRFLSGISVESNQGLLKGLLTNTHSSSECIKKTCQFIKELKRRRPSPERYINLFHCLFEMNDHSLHKQVQKYLKSPDGLSGELFPAHCSALAHMLLMSEEVLDEFDLSKYKTSEEWRKRLMPAVRCCRRALLADCKITEQSCEIVTSALQSSNSPLRELDLSQNDLQQSGEKLVSALLSPNCKLETLRLAGCALTEKSSEIVASALQSANSSLRELDLSQNDLQKSGEKLVSALQSPNCKLETLRLVGCGLTEKSGGVLAFALQSVNSHLRELGLSKNTLGDCGGKLSSGTLNPHCKIKTLRLAGCKLSEKPCEVVASAVQHMVSLTELDLSGNHMNITAVQLLNAGICSPNCKLQILRLADCKLTEKSCEIVILALQSANSPLRELDLSQNDLKVSGEKLLSALQSPKCKLETLRLVGCGLTEKSGGILAYALQSVNSHLREVNLSKNTLGDCGGKLSSGELNPHCKMETLRLAGCKLTEESCEVVASAVQHIVSLTELDLSDNHMNITAVQLLSAGISHSNCKLQILRLAGCKLPEESCEVVASAVQHMVSLTELDLSDNHLNIAGVHLSSALKGDINWKLQILRHARGELRNYACELTLDPNTACDVLSLSEGNRKVTCVSEEQPYPDHPERFDICRQVLCREGLTGRCYWEAEWSGDKAHIAVAYKSTQRKGRSKDCGFGRNAKSWTLWCSSDSYSAYHNNKGTDIPAPPSRSSRVGVYLDWPAGTLSFYSVSSNTLTHLHTFHSTFTEPLYPGFSVYENSSVSLCQIT